MRPSILNPLFAAITTLPGIGPRLGKLFESLAGPHVVDLCWHLPNGLIDRRFAPKVADAPDEFIASQMKGIIGIEIVITRIMGKWKVSQNRSAADREGVAAALAALGTRDSDADAMAAHVAAHPHHST